MNKWKNLQAYLNEKGVDSSTPLEETNRLKSEYRRLYLADFTSNKRSKRITINPNQQEFEELYERSEVQEMKLARYVLDAALAYGSSGYIMPSTAGLDKLISELNAIGHNINTVVKKMHSLSNYTDAFHYEQMQEQFKKIDTLILSYLTTPIKKEEDDY